MQALALVPARVSFYLSPIEKQALAPVKLQWTLFFSKQLSNSIRKARASTKTLYQVQVHVCETNKKIQSAYTAWATHLPHKARSNKATMNSWGTFRNSRSLRDRAAKGERSLQEKSTASAAKPWDQSQIAWDHILVCRAGQPVKRKRKPRARPQITPKEGIIKWQDKKD